MKKIEIEVSLCTGVNHTARVQGHRRLHSRPSKLFRHIFHHSMNRNTDRGLLVAWLEFTWWPRPLNLPESRKTIKGPLVLTQSSRPHLHPCDGGSIKVPWFPSPGILPTLTPETQLLVHILYVSWFSELWLTSKQGIYWLLAPAHTAYSDSQTQVQPTLIVNLLCTWYWARCFQKYISSDPWEEGLITLSTC